MPNCTFHIVDAFTAVPFTGNPCAVVTDADGIEPADMLRIARRGSPREQRSSRPASDKADVRVRYFMPRGEIPFAGHPTSATGHLLRELGVLKPGAVPVRHQRAARGHPPRQGDHDQPPPSGRVRRRRFWPKRSGFRTNLGKGFRAQLS